jgi:hypothetical protein
MNALNLVHKTIIEKCTLQLVDYLVQHNNGTAKSVFQSYIFEYQQ